MKHTHPIDAPLFQARAAGLHAAQAAEDHAVRDGWDPAAAERFIIGYLRRQGEASGEELVRQACGAGHTPHDSRAFGAVFQRLARRGAIVCVRADLPRASGHGTSGGRLWRIGA